MIIYKDLLKKMLLLYTITVLVTTIIHISYILITKDSLYYNTVAMYTLGVFSVSLVIYAIIFYTMCLNKTRKMYSLLHDDCDPDKALDEVLIQLENVYTTKSVLALTIFKGTCYHRLGMYNDAIKTFMSFNIVKTKTSKNTKLVWLHNLIMSYMNTHQTKNYEEASKYLKQLRVKYTNKTNLIDDYLLSQENYKKLMNYDYINVEKYYNDQLSIAFTKCEKVIYNAHLAKINKSLNKEYQKNIDFVLENGNTLCIVDEFKDGVK